METFSETQGYTIKMENPSSVLTVEKFRPLEEKQPSGEKQQSEEKSVKTKSFAKSFKMCKKLVDSIQNFFRICFLFRKKKKFHLHYFL